MPAACVPFGDAAARLKRRVGLAVLREARRDDALGSGESRIDIAGREGLVRDEIGLMLGIDRRAEMDSRAVAMSGTAASAV